MKKLRAVPTNGKEDVEVLAERARLERAEMCSKAINDLLESRNCQLTIVVHIGEALVPLAQILTLPASVSVNSK